MNFAIHTLLCATVMVAITPIDNASAQVQNLPPKKISTHLKGFTVPFKINNENGRYIEVQLYVSSDRGKSWNFYSKQDVNQQGFKFTCQQDGEYWFALKTLDRNRQLIPAGNVIRPELSIVVDSEKPILKFDIESDAAGRIIGQWFIEDISIDTQSILVRYRGVPTGGPVEPWTRVDLSKGLEANSNQMNDRVAWWPQTPSKRIEVELQVSDLAGNSSSITRTISLPVSTRRNNQASTSQAQSGHWKQRRTNPSLANSKQSHDVVCENGVCRIKDKTTPNVDFAQRTGKAPRVAAVGSAVEYIAPPAPGFVNVRNEQPKRPPVAANQNPSSSSIEWKSNVSKWTGQTQNSQSSTLENNQFPIPSAKKPELGINFQRYQDIPVVNRPVSPSTDSGQKSTRVDGEMVISESTTMQKERPQQDSWTAPKNYTQSTTDQNDHVGGLPISYSKPAYSKPAYSKPDSFSKPRPFDSARDNAEILSVNSRRFNLNYGIKAIDSSGVAKVILWATEDDGATWKSWTTDPDNNSPFPVEVERQGRYGFKITVNSKDGLIGKAPSSGDQPDIVVNVDLDRPNVRLTSAPYGSGRDIGKLVIHWEANDPFLTNRPIDLSYSPGPVGPWTTIAKRLRNSGTFAWKVPAQVPESIFLRIDARDEAGNVGSFQLTSPVDISGLIPRGQILGVEPIR